MMPSIKYLDKNRKKNLVKIHVHENLNAASEKNLIQFFCRALLVLAQSSLMKSSTYTSMNDSIHGASAGWYIMGPKSF